MAAGHGALEQAEAGVMLARSGLLREIALRWHVVVVAVGGTHSASATIHGVGLPCRGPERGPEQDSGEQTHPCAPFFPRSDRKFARDSHLLREEFYNRCCCGCQSGFFGNDSLDEMASRE